MRCTEGHRLAFAIAPGVLAVLGGCSPSPAPPAGAAPASAVAEAVRTAPQPVAEAPPTSPKPAARVPPPPPPRPATSWDALRRQAAHRIVAANPDGTYSGPVREPLLAIPVLEIELKRDGSVARVVVLRAPREARDTVALAVAAVHRAAPFGDVSHLPRPWRFTETFLFNDERKFKPRTLDE